MGQRQCSEFDMLDHRISEKGGKPPRDPVEENEYLRKFRNGCLVILPCRVGMHKIEACYIEPIRFVFYQPNIVMGAMGGRPD